MERNLLQKIHSASSGEDRIRALHEFNTVHANKFQLGDKKLVVDQLTKNISEGKITEEEYVASLITLRLLGRETDAMEALLTPDMLDFVCDFCMFPESSTVHAKETRIEAAKCLVNMIFKSAPLLARMETTKRHEKCLEILGDETITLNYAFPFVRIIYLLSRPLAGSTIHRQLANKGAIQTIFKLLKRITSMEAFPDPAHYHIIKDLLQVLFHLTIDMGSLNRTNESMSYLDYVPNYEDVVTTLLKIFNIKYPLNQMMVNADPPLMDLKNACLNCFVNIPLDFYAILVILGEKQLTVESLFDMLEYEVRTQDQDASKSVVTIFMVAQQLLAKAEEVRPYAFHRLFPGRDLTRERDSAEQDGKPVNMDATDKDADTVGNKIIKLMTSMSMAVKYVSNELLFSLVGENADDFVRLAGFGNAAGLLAMRNLFGMGKHLKRDTAHDLKAAEQDTKDEKKKPFPDLKGPKDGETEDEKEQRAIENFDKMMEAGIIKVIKKDDMEKDK